MKNLDDIGQAIGSRVLMGLDAESQRTILLAGLEKALGQERGPRATHKYIRREKNPKTGKYIYIYKNVATGIEYTGPKPKEKMVLHFPKEPEKHGWTKFETVEELGETMGISDDYKLKKQTKSGKLQTGDKVEIYDKPFTKEKKIGKVEHIWDVTKKSGEKFEKIQIKYKTVWEGEPFFTHYPFPESEIKKIEK